MTRIARRMGRRFLLEPSRSAFLIFLAVLSLILPFKILLLREARIGEFVPRTDLYLRRIQSESGAEFRGFKVAIVGPPSNRQLLQMFKRRINILENKFLNFFINSQRIERSRFFYWLPTPTLENLEEFNTGPQIHFTPAEEERGTSLLSDMGIPEGAWFVCFHARDSGYPDRILSRETAFRSSFRNCSIDRYIEAMRYVVACGGYAVRIGSEVLEKLPDQGDPKIIDYAWDHQSDFGDIYVLAKSKFLVGCTSGYTSVARMFDVPVLDANNVPVELLPEDRKLMRILLGRRDMYLPRPIWSKERNRLLSLEEILESEVSIYDDSNEFERAGLEVMENSAQDILDATREIYQRLEGTFLQTQEGETVQNRLRVLAERFCGSQVTPARFGTQYLINHEQLLD